MHSHLHTLSCLSLHSLSHEIALCLVMCPDIRVDRHSAPLLARPEPACTPFHTASLSKAKRPPTSNEARLPSATYNKYRVLTTIKQA